jgi:hypothetical protein
MKINRPGFTGPPPAENKADDKKVGKFELNKEIQQPQEVRTKGVSALESGLSEVARAAKAEGLKGEALASRVVDTVLGEVFGKDFMSRPDAAALRETIAPFVAQDEHLSAKINSLISRLGNK